MERATSSLINHYHGRTYRTELASAFLDIIRVLKDHCGPYAANAVLPMRGLDGLSVLDQYTKDGITIVKTLKTNTPLTDHVKRLAAYLGERVDNACHDGTTTAMLLFCELAARLLLLPKCANDTTLIDQNQNATTIDVLQAQIFSKSTPYLASAYQRQYARVALEQMLDDCEGVIKADTVTVDEIADIFLTTHEKAQWAVAYHQALVASKGDRELARGIADVLCSMPVELYSQYVLHSSGMESDDRFVLVQHDYDFEMNGKVVNPTDYNRALRSEFYIEDALLLVTPNELIRGNPETEFLIHLLNDPQERPLEKPLVILAPTINDPALFDAIQRFNLKYPSTKVVGIHIQVPQVSGEYANAIMACANAEPLADVMTSAPDRAFIDGVTILQRGNKVQIKNLYKKTEDALHPFYLDPQCNPRYTKQINELRDYIENIVKRHDVTKGSDHRLSHAISIYRMMASQRLYDLKIGGTSHEFVANIAVAKDAFGAAIAAIEHGVILGGHQRLLVHTANKLKWIDARGPKEYDAAMVAQRQIAFVFAEAFYNILSIIYFADFAPQINNLDELNELIEEFTEDFSSLGDNRKWFYLEAIRESLAPVDEDGFLTKPHLLYETDGFLDGTSSDSVLLQPVRGYQEFFKRLREILPKLINTVSLVDSFHGEST